jgi:hypothetical protein
MMNHFQVLVFNFNLRRYSMDSAAAAAAALLGGQSKMQMPQGVPADPEASKVSESE